MSYRDVVRAQADLLLSFDRGNFSEIFPLSGVLMETCFEGFISRDYIRDSVLPLMQEARSRLLTMPEYDYRKKGGMEWRIECLESRCEGRGRIPQLPERFMTLSA